jgi:hypothetical protein
VAGGGDKVKGGGVFLSVIQKVGIGAANSGVKSEVKVSGVRIAAGAEKRVGLGKRERVANRSGFSYVSLCMLRVKRDPRVFQVSTN